MNENQVRGREAIRIVTEELATSIGVDRTRAMSLLVKAKMGEGGTGWEWLRAYIEVIAELGDTDAAEAFEHGMARIKAATPA